jgi:hypothetical protein
MQQANPNQEFIELRIRAIGTGRGDDANRHDDASYSARLHGADGKPLQSNPNCGG